MRAVRPADLVGDYVNPRAVLRKQAETGKLRKIAHGVYVAVPDDAFDPQRWRPAFEAAAGAIGTALFGDKNAVVMGITAARLHRVVPRAHARADLAVPRRHDPVRLADRATGTVKFHTRDLGQLDVQPVKTELGTMLVTTPEQTIVDLVLHRGAAEDADTRDALRALARRADWRKVDRIVAATRGGKAAQPVLQRLRDEQAA